MMLCMPFKAAFGCDRRLSALAAAAQAVQAASSALASLASGGEDVGQPVQSALLQRAVVTAPEEGSPAWETLQTIKSSLDYPQAPVKVRKQCASDLGIEPTA